jgi:hypothetical protein
VIPFDRHPEIGDRVLDFDGRIEAVAHCHDVSMNSEFAGKVCVRLRLATDAAVTLWVEPTSTPGLWKHSRMPGEREHQRADSH